jgi:AcrR family transcriptional regulator
MPDAREEQKTKFDLRREASYEALVRSAMRCFYERGYTATRVDDIATGAGHTSGAVYYHFGSKAGAFWAVDEFRRAQRAGWENVVEGLDPATPLEEIVRRVFGGFGDALEGMHAWTLVAADFRQSHRDDPEAMARLASLYSSWIDELRGFVERLQNGGWVEPVLDPRLVAKLLFGFVEGMSSHAIVFALSPADLRETLVAGVLRIFQSAAHSKP